MNILIVADALEQLNPKSDTGLYLARSALKRGHIVYWSTPNDITLVKNELRFYSSRIIDCPEASLPTKVTKDMRISCADINTIWIRKDPPFDSQYQSMCWKLRLAPTKIKVLNPVESLLLMHEKLIPMLAVQAGYLQETDILLSNVGRKEALLVNASEIALQPPFIAKPWLGFGGQEVALVKSLTDLETESEQEWIVQDFIVNIADLGDRRVLFIDGKAEGNFVRLPRAGSVVANLAQGGTAVLRESSARLQEIYASLGSFLKNSGIFLAGADFIGEQLSEVNITAPTGFASLHQLNGIDLGKIYVERVENIL